MPPRPPKLTPAERELMREAPEPHSARDEEAFLRGYRNYAQMQRIHEEVARGRPRVASAYVAELYETGEISNLEFMFRDLYEYYESSYDDRDELTDVLRDIVSPTAGVE